MTQKRTFTALGAIVVVFVALFAAACQTETIEVQILGAEDSALGDALRDGLADSPGGVAAVVVRDGEVTRAAAGAANADGDPLNPDAAFRVGSISKTFVAAMVLQMVEEGKVARDAPLASYLPETAVGDDVTVQQLLGHRSGIPNYTDQPSFFQDALADPARAFTPAQVLSYVEGVEAPVSRGVFRYSNTNYILLGQLIEDIDGVDLDTALTNRITGPLRMDSTTFGTDPLSVPTTLAGGWSGEELQGDPTTTYRSVSSGAWAAGALISTTDDLRTFLAALFDGEVISQASLSQMTDTGDADYGLGLAASELGPGVPAFGHDGGIPGYTSSMAINPDTGDMVVVLTNSDERFAGSVAARIVREW